MIELAEIAWQLDKLVVHVKLPINEQGHQKLVRL
jgi:hypothetical protein